MPGFFYWISEMFSPSRSVKMDSSPRLLNPASKQNEEDAVDQLSTRNLEQYLFCWLLDTPPSMLN
jgi:hypothetical protein